MLLKKVYIFLEIIMAKGHFLTAELSLSVAYSHTCNKTSSSNVPILHAMSSNGR